MAIQYVGGQTVTITASTATNTTITFALTGGIDTVPRYGDVVILTYAIGSTVARTPAMVSSGYTAGTAQTASDSFDANQNVFYKLMPLTPDTTVVVGPTGATTNGGAVTIQVFRGVAPTIPLVYTPANATGINGSAVNPPATGTATEAGCVAVLTGSAAAGAALTFTAAYLTNFTQAASGATTNRTQVGMGWISVTNGTSYDGAAWTPSTTANTMSWVSQTILLRPSQLITSYTNDFESGNFNTCVTSYGGSSVVTGQGQGTYSAAVTLNTTGFGVVPTDDFSTTTFYSRLYFKINKTANPTVAGEVFGPVVRLAPNTGLVETRFNFDTSGVINMRLSNAIVSAYMLFPGPTITPDIWYVLDFDIIVNGTTSTFTARLNGTQIVTSTTENFSTAKVIGQDIMALGYTNGPAGTIYYDALQYSTTALTPTASVSVSVTGISSTGDVGTLTASGGARTTASGVSGAGQVGVVDALLPVLTYPWFGIASSPVASGQLSSNTSVFVSVTGVSSTGDVGTVSASAGARVSVTGDPASGQVGSVSTTASARTTLTGVSGTGQVGTPTVITGIFVTPTGVFATGAIGTVAPATGARITLTGVSSAGQVGTVTISAGAIVSVTGVQATGQVGTAVAQAGAQVSVTGVQATGQVGQLDATGKANVTLTGVAGTGQVGQATVLPITYANVTGVQATGQVGQADAVGKANVFPTGVVGTGQIGQVAAGNIIKVSVTGVSGTGDVGQVTTAAGAKVYPTGVVATGQVGQATVTGTATVSLTGVQSSTALGTVTVLSRAYAYLVGVQAEGQVNGVLVWGPIIPASDPNYQPVMTPPTSVWVDIGTTASSYTDVVPNGSSGYAPITTTNTDWTVVAA